ncbi:MAG: carbohydrate kinase [Bacteroidales bacterium]|nr:carbohydrate kinase [Bacteroidales bacterium]
MDKKIILGIGEIVWDHIGSRYCLGGAPYNFAHFAKELGGDAYVVSAVGRDELGRKAVRMIKKDNVYTDLIQKSLLPTGVVEVDSSVKNDPKYNIVENVAWDAIALDPKALEIAGKADVVCWGALAQRSSLSKNSILALVDAAPKKALKVFDINIRQHYYSSRIISCSLQRANILKLNQAELPLIASVLKLEGDPVEALFKRYRGLQLIVYTCGEVCSRIYDRLGMVSEIRTPKVKVKDTVGAGDSFTATLVSGILNGMSVPEAHAKAVMVSAEVCKSRGAIVSLQ